MEQLHARIEKINPPAPHRNSLCQLPDANMMAETDLCETKCRRGCLIESLRRKALLEELVT